VSLPLLGLWCLFVFFVHLDIVLRSDEGLYAAIARRIVERGEWFPLVYQGQPYVNKPPLYFWLMALSMHVWGPTEFAARFPSATFGVLTVALVYGCGRTLAGHRLGLLSAVIATTTLSTVWHAHEARFDIPLAFWINLAFFGLYLAFRQEPWRRGPFWLALGAMAGGTMLKGPVALLLPVLAALGALAIARRDLLVRRLPILLGGFGLLLLLLGAYYSRLGGDFNVNFFVNENLVRVFRGDKSVFFYVGMFPVNFLPWSVFLPAVALHLARRRFRELGQSGAVAGLWLAGFFLVLSVPAAKSERFLVYLIPPFALLMGMYWQWLVASPRPGHDRVEDASVRVLSALLALGAAGALLASPQLVARRLPLAQDVWSTPVAVLVGAAGLATLYAAARARPATVLAGVVGLALALTIGVVHVFFPALGRYDSAEQFSREIRAVVGRAPLVIFAHDANFAYDLLYYLERPEPVPVVRTVAEAREVFGAGQPVFALMLDDRFRELVGAGEVPIRRLERHYRRRLFVLAGSGT
jgi:4-amino-4-deoxy-L-arabinose transferase-like glycosyltransferase